jgi:hypothetical protein
MSSIDQLHTPPEGGATPKHWVYHCDRCGRTETASDADVIFHLRHEFPTCCLRQMSLDYREPSSNK